MRALEPCRPRVSSRLALFALIAVGVAGCSGDATRFSDNPFASPYASRSTPTGNDVTGSVPPQSATAGRVETQALPPPPNSRTRSDVTGSLPPSAAPANRAAWNWDGGTPITVGTGETVDSIAHKYGVPAAAIMQANGITAAASVRPGQRLVIPRYHHGSAPATRIASSTPVVPASAGPVAPAAASGTHVVAPGETLSSVARLYHKPRAAIAKASNIALDTKLRIGQRLVIPGAKPTPPGSVAARPTAPLQGGRRTIETKSAAKSQGAPPAGGPKVATADTPPSAHITTPVEPSIESESGAAGEPTASAPSFRWPVRGRIITPFGPRANAPQSDGINLAVPEGTSVKAAEDGVVAYAGNELKGYGNLVLLRHSSGYVTAYAHASELMVKRGDHVKRGQIIARAGQTGSVSAPQLHFEIRKGKVPVDPTQYLPAT